MHQADAALWRTWFHRPFLMPFGIGDAIGIAGVAADVFGGLNTNETNLASAREVMAFNEQENQRDRLFNAWQNRMDRMHQRRENLAGRKFSREMSSTAHQRQVRDLRKAGINPILTARYGGASTPTASASSGGTGRGASGGRGGQMARVENVIGKSVHTAKALRMAKSEIGNIEANTGATEATEALTHANEKNVKEQTENTKAQRKEIIARTAQALQTAAREGATHNKEQALAMYYSQLATNAGKTGKRLDQDIKGMEQTLKGLMSEGEIDETWYGKAVRYLNRLAPWKNSAAPFIPRTIRHE